VEKTDLILTNKQTSSYILYESRKDAVSWENGLSKVSYQGLDFYYTYHWRHKMSDQLWKAFHLLSQKADLEKTRRIWLVNIGWGYQKELMENLRTWHFPKEWKLQDMDFLNYPAYTAMIGKKSINDGAAVFAFKTSSILKELSRRYK
jgi:hypothetical protein